MFIAAHMDSIQPTDPEVTRFAAETLRNRLRALVKETDGARSAKEIEHVHRMRVATRRLNVALNLFAPLFPTKLFKRWHKQLRGLRKALADARDTDVQILFLEDFSGRLEHQAHFPGVIRLLLRKRQQRDKLQSRVIKAIEEFESSDTIPQLRAALHELEDGPKTDTVSPEAPPNASLLALARLQIQETADEVREHEGSLTDTENFSGHHAMRIEAKHLRYTLEVFAPLYAGELKSQIGACKRAQELLGQIHDLDLWAEIVPAFIERETRRTQRFFGYDKPMKALLPGVEFLLQFCQSERAKVFEEFVSWWSSEGRAAVLGDAISIPAKSLQTVSE